MASQNTQFAEFIEGEVKKYRGVYVPVKAGVTERLLVRKIDPDKLHPNPEDEFCDPAIGPNFGIIGDYIRMINQYGTLRPNSWDEPVIIQKIRPDGYMILNGHHRWAAALRTGLRYVPVQIVNLTQETDIRKMIEESKHDKRVTLDLDEVIFCEDESMPAEKPLPFPQNKIYKERIRRGVPALLHFLSKQGYDVWVYTAKYYSDDYIRAYFKRYSVKVDGIITGTGRKTGNAEEARKRTEKLFSNHYIETLHIDRESVLRTRRDTGDFEEHEIHAEPDEWSHAVMTIIKGLS